MIPRGCVGYKGRLNFYVRIKENILTSSQKPIGQKPLTCVEESSDSEDSIFFQIMIQWRGVNFCIVNKEKISHCQKLKQPKEFDV